MRAIDLGNRLFLAAALALVFVLSGCPPSTSSNEHDDHEGHSEEGEEHDDHEGHSEGEEDDDDHEGHSDEEEEEEEGVVALSVRAVDRLGIVVETASSGRLNDRAAIPAEVETDPRLLAHVVSLVHGRLSEVYVQLGDVVSQGDALADIESLELGLVRAEYEEARALRDVAESHYERQQSLSDEGITSERELINAEGALRTAEARVRAARTTLQVYEVERTGGSTMSINSPINGTIIDQHATPGEAVDTERSLFVVADLSRVWVVGQIYEQDIQQVAVGDAAIVSLRAYPGRMWNAEIDFIAPTLDDERRTLGVRVVLDNSDGTLRPGLYGQLALQTNNSGPDVALVAFEAVQEIEERTVVFVPGEHEGEFESCSVVVGRVSDGLAEILAGLEPGEAYVARGAFALKSALLAGELGSGHAH